MAVQMMPSGFEGLAEVVAGLGGVLGERHYAEQNERTAARQAIVADPQRAAALGRMVNMATVGMSPEEVEQIVGGFAETFSLDPELMNTLRTANVLTPDEIVGVKMARNPAYTGLLEQGNLREAEAKLVTTDALMQEALLSGTIARKTLDSGLIDLQLNRDRLQANFDSRKIRYDGEMLDNFTEWYNQLPAGSELKNTVGIMVNEPQIGEYLLSKERNNIAWAQLAAQEEATRLARKNGQEQTLIDRATRMWEFEQTIRNEVREVTDRLIAARGDEEAVTAAVADLEDIRRRQERMVNMGAMMPTPLLTAQQTGLWKKEGFDVSLVQPESRAQRIARGVQSGVITPEEANAAMNDPEFGFRPDELRDFQAMMAQGQEQTREGMTRDVVPTVVTPRTPQDLSRLKTREQELRRAQLRGERVMPELMEVRNQIREAQSASARERREQLGGGSR